MESNTALRRRQATETEHGAATTQQDFAGAAAGQRQLRPCDPERRAGCPTTCGCTDARSGTLRISLPLNFCCPAQGSHLRNCGPGSLQSCFCCPAQGSHLRFADMDASAGFSCQCMDWALTRGVLKALSGQWIVDGRKLFDDPAAPTVTLTVIRGILPSLLRTREYYRASCRVSEDVRMY